MKKKILLYHNILWSHYTGKVFSELSKLLLGSNFTYKVIHIATSMNNRKGIGLIDKSFHQYDYSVLFDSCIEEVSIFKKFLSIQKKYIENNPDILILTGYTEPSYWLLMLIHKLRGRQLILTADSTKYDQPRFFWKEKFKSLLLKLPNKIMCYGEMHKSYLKALGVNNEKIHIRVQATINEQARLLYSKSEGLKKTVSTKKNFLFVGRLIPEKNILTLFKAFSCLETDDWGLFIVGDGIEKDKIESFVYKNNIKNVYLEGSKTLNEVIDYYKEADVFVLPSISETWGLVVNEAMLCEMPIIVSTHCGCSSDLVKEGKNGFSFNPNDVEELTKVMKKFVLEEVNMSRMKEESLNIVRGYTPEISAKQMFEGIIN